MDVVLKLRELRRLRRLTQGDVARLSGVGEKTISSFETGDRIGSLKVAQLERIVAVYGLTLKDFFGGTVETELAPWELDPDEVAAKRLLDEVGALPKPVQRSLVAKFQLMIETVRHVYGGHDNKSGEGGGVRARSFAERREPNTDEQGRIGM